MSAWAGLALALRRPEDDALRSRVPTYLHPLAGRALAWHGLRALAAIDPSPDKLVLATAIPIDPSVIRDLAVDIVAVDPMDWWPAVSARLGDDIERVLVVDAAAATLSDTLRAVVGEPTGVVIRGEGGTLAAWLDIDELAGRASQATTLTDLAHGLRQRTPVDPGEDCLVRDRMALARAGAVVRDRLVVNLMNEGATFLLPQSVLVDVDVRIGQDTVIYPGVVLEGDTAIGSETVIGPGCRIIDSWVGSGVEMKGWNYVVGTRIRNRAVLEPYVRRGFD